MTALRVVHDQAPALPAVVDEVHVARVTRALMKSITILQPRWSKDWSTLIGVELAGNLSEDDHQAAIHRIEESLQPVGAERIVTLLQNLRLTTASKGIGTTELGATF